MNGGGFQIPDGLGTYESAYKIKISIGLLDPIDYTGLHRKLIP